MRTVAGHRLSPEHGRLAIDTEDTVTVQFETEAGVIGTFCGSQVARGRKNRLALEISGSAESFAFDQERAEHLWVGDAEGHRVIVRDPKTLSGAAARYATLPSGHAQGYQECFNAFVGDTYAAVAGRTPDGLPSFEDGSRSATIVEAVLDSVDSSGAWIELPTGRKVAA